MKKSRKDDVIKIANCIIRKNGYSNLSFINIAKALDVTRENVHHYFKKKELLGNACLEVMLADLNDRFLSILNSDTNSIDKLKKYFKIYKIQENETEDCPIVSLLAEYELLPESMQIQVKQLIEIEQYNMEKILEKGLLDKSFYITKDVKDEASLIISLLKGAVSYGKVNGNFEKTIKLLLESLIKNDD